VKYVEYKHKWEAGLLWGEKFSYDPAQAEAHGEAPPAGEGAAGEKPAPPPKDVGLFFSIYFGMTGLHGIHVIVGMGLMIWLLVGAVRGRYSSVYFTPVDNVGCTGTWWTSSGFTCSRCCISFVKRRRNLGGGEP